jgi:thiamine biosynthesis lipoprotein ApbE
MRKILILMMAIVFCLSCASMTPEEKKRQERMEMYRLYLNTGMRDESLTDEEVKKLDELKARYNRYDAVIWQ